MTESSDPQAYFLEIEAHFAMRRNTVFILSPKDWMLMKQWHSEGVPLPVVIEAIDSVFEKNETSGRRKTISSLSYCKHAVKDLWSERRELYVGDAEALPEAGLAEPLRQLADEVARVDAALAEELRGLVREASVPRVEERLIELERTLIERAFASLAEEEREAIEREIARSLGDTSRLDEKTLARTKEANLRRIVRDRFALPRLTLFR